MPTRNSSPCLTSRDQRKRLNLRSFTNQRDARNPERGGALLAVLWLAAALSAIAFSVAVTVRSETDRVSSSSDGLRAAYLATGSVERAVQWMEWGYTNGVTRFWRPNQPRMVMSFPTGDATVELIPESSKLNVNTASPDDLLRVVATVTGNLARSREIVAAIIDWRSPSREFTVFDQAYLALSPTFHARHASFEEIEELLLVRGMTPEVFYGNYIPNPNGDPNARMLPTGGLRDCLSVWGGNGPFDLNTASPALMEAMGVPPQGVEQIVARRTIQPFRNPGEVAELGIPTPRMGFGGNVIWTLRASARLRRPDHSPSEVVRTSAAVVKLVDEKLYPYTPVHILRWYEDAWSQAAVAPPAIPFVIPQPGVPSGAFPPGAPPPGAPPQ